MAALAGDLTKTILGQSDAAKAFRPWWDSIEDGIMYALVVMGMITLPMTFLSNTPLECTIHPEFWYNNLTTDLFTHDDVPKYARYLSRYSKKYCTEMHVSPFLLYFPFSMFMVPLIIVFIERSFIKFYNSDEKLEQFYTCLLKNSLEREDVANLEQENIKNSHEIQQMFRNSRDCHNSYLFRTAIELVTSLGLISFYGIFNSIDGIASAIFDCDVHGINFKCIIPNSRFFWVTYFLAMCLLVLYIILTTYNLIWIVHSGVPKLERILKGMERRANDDVEQLQCTFRPKSNEPIVPEVRLDMYFDKQSKDFRLLMNLLSETAGLAHTFRILAVFDKHFQRLWRANDIKVIIEEDSKFYREDSKLSNKAVTFKNEGEHEVYVQIEPDKTKHERPRSVWVLWNDAKIAEYMKMKARRNTFEYTVDINPCTEAPVKSYLYHGIPDFTASPYDMNLRNTSELLFTNKKRMRELYSYKYRSRFDGLLLDSGTDYSISVSTELDGKTITQVSMAVAMSNKDSKKEDEDKKDKDKKSKDSENKSK